jgi:hypothetical protein
MPSKYAPTAADDDFGRPPRVNANMEPSVNYNIFTMDYYQRESNTIVDALCCFFTYLFCASFCYPFSCFCNVFSMMLAKNDTSENHFTRVILFFFNVIALFWYFVAALFLLYVISFGAYQNDDDDFVRVVKEVGNGYNLAQNVLKNVSPF